MTAVFDQERLLGVLTARGLVSSKELQAATGKSQASISRALAELSARIVKVGGARSTRYGLPKLIRGEAAQQPIRWIDEQGASTQIGLLTFLSNDTIHIDSSYLSTRGLAHDSRALPWFMAPLRAQGFLGRLHAQRLNVTGLTDNPERWSLEDSLFSALHLHDAAGAMVLGIAAPARNHPLLPLTSQALGGALDHHAQDVAGTLPAGSSAGGEQPKFLAIMDTGEHVLVKFTPPRGTPAGERWSDLLHAEALASQVLSGYGADVAKTRVLETTRRTYLLSARFDRVGAHGRRHVVSIGDAHRAFVPDAYVNWAVSTAALARQGRLEVVAAEQAAALLSFGRLIGNADMHSGNLGLRVDLAGMSKGRFKLAPVYDMLPMRWRPNVAQGDDEYWPFEPEPAELRSAAAKPAREFWSQLSHHPRVSQSLRKVAGDMASRFLVEPG